MSKPDATSWIRNAGRGALECAACRSVEGQPGVPAGGHRQLPCSHAFCLPCLRAAWHHAPSGGQCPGCLASQDNTGSRAALLQCVPLLGQGGKKDERDRGAELLERAIVSLGKAIERREAAQGSDEGLASRATLYASLASLLEARDRVRGGDPSEELVRAWLCACSCPDAEGVVETTNWLGYGRALYYKSDREPSIMALRRARECAIRMQDEFNRRLVGIYLAQATLLDEPRGALPSIADMSASLSPTIHSHVEDIGEAGRLLDDVYQGFEVEGVFWVHGKDFGQACAFYAERAMACEPGSLQLTTAVDYHLGNWVKAPDCDASGALQHSYGKALRRLGRTDLAVDHLTKATEINPRSAESWGNLGIALRQQGQLQASAEAQRRAIDLQPDSGIGAFNLANVLLELNELHSSLEFFNEAERLGVPPSKAILVEKSQALIFEALKCGNCKKPLAEICCSRCKNVFYCNASCKKEHKSKHKSKCKKLQKRPIESPKFMSPWLCLRVDEKGNCELRTEEGRRIIDKAEVKKKVGPGEGPQIIMEQNGEHIRRIEMVGKIKGRSKVDKLGEKVLGPKPPYYR